MPLSSSGDRTRIMFAPPYSCSQATLLATSFTVTRVGAKQRGGGIIFTVAAQFRLLALQTVFQWFFRMERLEVLKKMDMLCILEVTQIPPSRGKSCPPAYFITCSASVATSTAESIIMRVVRASPLSNLAN